MKTKIIEEFLIHSNYIEGVRDEQSHIDAMTAWEYLIKQKVMTIDVVLKTHKILMLRQPLLPCERGYFRMCGVRVGSNLGMRHEKIREAIGDWCGKTMNARKSAKKLHIEYEKIHPFIDGNGRTGRMFMNWTRLRKRQPIIIIREEDIYKYYKWFN